jgi:hypothetical protein
LKQRRFKGITGTRKKSGMVLSTALTTSLTTGHDAHRINKYVPVSLFESSMEMRPKEA